MTNIETARIEQVNDEIHTGLWALRPALSKNLIDKGADRQLLEEIVASPYHDQILARLDGQIVGAATMSLILGGVSGGRKAWLEDLVVTEDEHVRGKGVGHALWKEIISWSLDKQVEKLEFTSSPSREDAHAFYNRQGAQARDTTVFSLSLG